MATDTSENVWYYAFGLFIFGALTFGAEYLSMKYRPARKLLEGEPTVVVHNGNLSVLPKSTRQPVTLEDMGLQGKYQGLSSELVVDGVVIEQNLKQNNLSRDWLDQQLKNRNINDIREVVLAGLDTQGKLYIDLKKDNLNSPRDITD